MREIKFRAWDGEMMKPCNVLTDGKYTGMLGVFNYPVMQYTGLKDKNFVEIYDNDLITNPSRNGNKPHVVEWSETFGGWVGLYKGLAYLIAQELSEIKVIGNIHENPELL